MKILGRKNLSMTPWLPLIPHLLQSGEPEILFYSLQSYIYLIYISNDKSNLWSLETWVGDDPNDVSEDTCTEQSESNLLSLKT